ncbi:hypothetical protein HMPREF2983_01580 [Prevotella sp. HMSC077E09]|jgi:tetratricopeptide repeat protein|uniref:hypothetical protein n=1 Tax=Prevotellaceae TaxID=171552 RepID=UPI0008A4BCFE|nr:MULTISPECIES: hypothetical protein [Prevotellaceae]OFO71864.1 hypothetical protein HMPREF3018_11905 [Prevotella sp. HMSC077E08]OFP52894.1 hypothetical protein HMPREF2983_01580 [Prevotella sp. HMSC077E09]
MKKILICVFICLPLIAWGQKKTMTQVKDYIKSGKNLDKAEKLMTDLLNDSSSRGNEKVWLLLFESQRKQYDQGNEKLYLKEKYDTTALFLVGKRMFDTLEGLDSLDRLPDARGKVKLKYRDRSAELLNIYRPNLFNGGVFFMKKHDFSRAYDFFDTYINSAVKPMFARYQYAERDKRLPEAAYWASYCGYKLEKPQLTLRHTYQALKDSVHLPYMLQYLSETYKLEKDTARYVQTLKDGFSKYPKFPFFFPRLIDYYSHIGAYDEAMKSCDEALQTDSVNTLFRYAKSSLLLTMGRYKQSFAISKALIAENDTLADAYLNAGLALFDQAVELDKKTQSGSKKYNQILELYRKAMPYLEKYRAMAPDQKDKWALPLYTIYLNLNMGKQFDEIDKLI